MAYDPALPLENTEIAAPEMRSQLQGLFGLIQAVPAGPQGIPGPPGAGVANAIIDSVSTLNPGDPVQVTVSYDVATSTIHLSFGIPKGGDGSNGSNGNDGSVGPPFTNFVIDSITMLNPGDAPSAQATFDGTAVHLVFNIPRGFNGNDGTNGIDGGIGPPGPAVANAVIDAVTTLNAGEAATVTTTFDSTTNTVHYTFGIPMGFSGANGIDGEVTNATLASAISGTSSNSDAVATLDTPFVNDPPTLADMELMRSKVNELITALRR